MKSLHFQSFYSVSNQVTFSMSQDFSCKKSELSFVWTHSLSQNYQLINDKQSILYYIRLPGDFRLIKVIGHASFASSAVFLSFLHLSPHLYALEQQRDSRTQVQRRFTQQPPSREHPQYANCKQAAGTCSRFINFGFTRPSLQYHLLFSGFGREGQGSSALFHTI